MYLQHSSWLARRLRAQGARREVADDVVQETYVRIARYDSEIIVAQPKALLLQIARNILRDQMRLAERRTRPSFQLGLMAQQSNSGDAEQFEGVLLQQIVRALPPSCRDVFVLTRFGGMSYAEIAALKKLSVKTVERRMSQALALCAASLRA